MGVALSEAGQAAESNVSVRVRKRLEDAKRSALVLDVDFTAPVGITILFGASGAGKTTLLDCIAGLQKPDEGHIRSGDTVLFDSAERINLPPHRRQIGYLLQTLALFPHMTVARNVAYGIAGIDTQERASRVDEILQSFHIAGLAQRRPADISGGERQRVALARALVTRPRTLLLDEPLSALDAVTKARIIDDLRTWNQRQRIPIVFVTHDREEVFALGERVLAMENGRIVAEGSPHRVLSSPERESVAQLSGFENIFECSVTASHSEQGTMTCRIAGSSVELEAPLTRLTAGKTVNLGIRAGDILLATSLPHGLSARNLIAGTITSLEQRDVTIIAQVDCGANFEVHLTPGAVQSLQLFGGAKVWLIVKTYSCHVMQ